MRFLSQWISLSLALLILVGVVGLDLYRAHEAIGTESRERLLRQAEVVNKNLTQRLQTTSNALDSIRADLAWPA